MLFNLEELQQGIGGSTPGPCRADSVIVARLIGSLWPGSLVAQSVKVEFRP